MVKGRGVYLASRPSHVLGCLNRFYCQYALTYRYPAYGTVPVSL